MGFFGAGASSAERVTLSIKAVPWERSEGRGGSDARGQVWSGGRESSRGWSRTSVHVLNLGLTPALAACCDSLQTKRAEVEAVSALGSWAGGGALGAISFLSPRPSSDAQSPWAPVRWILFLFAEPSPWRTPSSSCPRWLPTQAATTYRLLMTRTGITRPASPSLLPWRVSKRPGLGRMEERIIKSWERGSRGSLGRWNGGRGGRLEEGSGGASEE